ncbi:MAG: TonB-dependent receptor [Nitrospinae bacterium]|nr:TonB-dependent receptor [Nitrospinota bacterium]
MSTHPFRLFIMAALAVAPVPAWAESSDDVSILMPETVISASRWEESMTDTTDRTTVITEEEIAALPANNAADIINHAVGVNVDALPSPVNMGFPAVNGASERETLVMVNGIPISDLSNHTGIAGQIPADAISRIEVLYGPSGSEWGSMLGGAINIITHDPNRPRANRVSAAAGNYGYKSGAASLQYGGETLSLSVTGAMLRGDGPGPDDHTAYKDDAVVASAGVKLGESTNLLVQGHSFQGHVGTGDYRRDLAGLWYKYQFMTNGVGASLTSALPVGEARVTLYRQNMTQQSIGYQVTEEVDNSRLEDNLTGYSAIWHATLGATTVTLGGDGQNADLHSTALENDSYKHDPYGAFLTLQHDLTDEWRVQAGTRYSDEDVFGTATTYNVGLLRRFGERSAARLSVSTGYNTPPLGYRYYTGGGYFQLNPDLAAEKVTMYETGVHAWASDTLVVDASLYHAIVKDAINFVLLDAENYLYTYRNFEEFTRQGAQLAVKWMVADSLTLDANAMWQTVKDETSGEVVKGQIRAAYNAGISYDDGRFMGALTALWRDWNADPSYEAKDKELYADAKIGYTHALGEGQSVRIVGSVYNLTDVQLWTDAWLPVNDPRTYQVKAEYLF